VVRRIARMIPPLLAALALAHPAAKLLARCDWRLDLLTHFQEPALALTVVAAAALLVARRRRFAVALLVLAAFQLEPVVRFSLPNPVPPRAGALRLRLLMANVLVDNYDHEALSRLIRDEDPDVVCLVEVSADWVVGLRDVARAYPYRVDYGFNAQGLSLWFKQKPYHVDPPSLPTPDGWPYLRATFSFAGEPRRLWLIHPASPMRRMGQYVGFPDLAALGEIIREEGGSAIVLGDFNTTDGSPYFRDFAEVTGLRDSRLGFGRQGSWPVGSPYRITIDHALVSGDLAVVDRRLGPEIGSDHRPFILDLAPSASASKTGAAQASASAR